jgi:hypothetical protein
MPFFRRKTDPRLYVELLFHASSFFANPPSSRLELGDYGVVSEKTGEFVRSGNILQVYPGLVGSLGEGDLIPEAYKYFYAARREGTAQGIDVDA